jgi:hypothetical protein
MIAFREQIPGPRHHWKKNFHPDFE